MTRPVPDACCSGDQGLGSAFYEDAPPDICGRVGAARLLCTVTAASQTAYALPAFALLTRPGRRLAGPDAGRYRL